MVGESDEEVFANLDKLGLNEDEALVLYGAQSKTWSMTRDQSESNARIDNSPIASRGPSVPSAQVEDSDCETEGDVQVCQMRRARTWYHECPTLRARSLEPPSFTHLAPKAEIAAVSNHPVLAADDSRSFFF